MADPTSYTTRTHDTPAAPGLQSAAPPAGPIPGYQVLEELGRGGMGIVYKARQLSLDRLVALKMILPEAPAGDAEIARFRSEAQTVACLQHPNVVQIYEVGELDGRPFLSLEYVDGGTLAQKAGRPWPVRQAAQVVEALARGVHAAHRRGVVHRDLKPSNILLTSDGTPKVTDFGIAKRLAGGLGHTRAGAILGTPCYMAPEQAIGRTDEIGPHTDVWALGAILYELLTGRPPFMAESAIDILQKVKFEEPVAPGRLRFQLPRSLETICLTCLHKDSARRYASALALADDLQAFLEGRPIAARPPGTLERAAAWVQRRPTVAALAAVGGAAAVGLGAGAWWYNPLAVSAVAVLAFVTAVWWHGVRLRAALREAARQQAIAERQVERMNLVLELTYRLVTITDTDELLRVIGETSARITHADRATIYLIDRGKRELWSKVATGEGMGEIRVPLGVGVAGTVAETGEVVNIPDAYADARFNPEIDRRSGYRTANLLTLPMTAPDGRMVGVLQVLNKRDGPFDGDDQAALAALGASAAVAVENARLRRGSALRTAAGATTDPTDAG
jgi:serine/threonine-protein kinase